MTDGMKLHNEALHSLYSSANIIRLIKPRRVGSEGHHTVNIRNLNKNLMGGKYLEDLCTDGRIILKWALQEQSGEYRLDSFRSEVPATRFFCKW
jgi:hypothetical protein